MGEAHGRGSSRRPGAARVRARPGRWARYGGRGCGGRRCARWWGPRTRMRSARTSRLAAPPAAERAAADPAALLGEAVVETPGRHR
ncbi:hypothetical protein SCATT_47180 [Streptantibioticus cattleyicolor NRRL 8057 = DSM 46488]|uniref:Uncharacterized protein n=1 Tax=Streptantibioticus cattleyicolor (strain ATCC 35852 / DSM 46488 / JCM 4925 / NBRC 14057 / NRRL 8057) TaxID=1003195 RepID=G8WT66_STREN|nr:hypothetical protein SCATT_47180 [Streptantibioticus cattleyicolor NRRL 8057 = DSM 46488]